MRLIVSFNGRGFTINFEDIVTITDHCDYIILVGEGINIVVNAFNICSVTSLIIWKSWLSAADEVYFDTRIEEAKDGKNSTSDL